MVLDLAQFHDAFFEECYEALDSMEAALLNLSVGTVDKEQINTVFRVAHSIKGGSATFGFTEITSFTHTLETLLDELRSGKMHVTRGLSDLLLKSVDVMRDMLRAVQRKEPIDAQRTADLQFDLELAIAQKENADPASTSQSAPVSVSVSGQPAVEAVTVVGKPETVKLENGQRQWKIDFRPLPQLFAHGNDPLRMLRELTEIGKLDANLDLEQLPPFKELDPESCYIGWSMTLVSEVTQDVVEQVFDWAEGDCELRISELRAESHSAVASSNTIALTESTATSSIPVAAAPITSNEQSTPAVATSVPAASSEAAVAKTPPQIALVKPTQAAGDSAPENGRAAGGDSSSIRVSIEKIDELMNTVGELVITQSMLSQLGSRIEGPLGGEIRAGLVQLERNVRELQESVMRVRMLPISFVFSRFPRMVRDLSHRLNKQVELKVTGDQTELDKTVMEKIGDPLTHLVRNCIDHGIEQPEERIAAGKNPVGTLHLNAYHKGGSITIEVGDDGGGLNRDRILAKARSRNLVGATETLTDDQVHEMIFLAGFSTAEKTTDISGRGVGMDVVRRNVKALGGSIEVKSESGKGSRFIINLPLTLAIVDGQSVSVGTETYIVPLTTIVESLQLKPTMVNRVAGRGEVFSFRDDYVPVIRLHDLFGVEPRTRVLHEGLLMIVEGDGRRAGLFVDELLGQQQVVIKSLETNYRRVDGVSGATILGDGSVALILDVPGLIRVAADRMAALAA